MNNKIINISKKTFVGVVIVLFSLVILAIALTYVIPRGEFAIDNGEPDYSQYIPCDESVKGINILKGIFAPLLVLTSSDSLRIIGLLLFLITIAGAFQVMGDCNGIKLIVRKLTSKFGKHKKALVALVILVFMCFGSFFGLFEESLMLLPFILALSLSLGYDSYTGFLICIVATGFGFASAITNPFTVIVASTTIGADPMMHIWYRLLIFVAMYCLLVLFVFRHLRAIENNPEKSPTYQADEEKRIDLTPEIIEDNKDNRRIRITYTVFLLLLFVTTITVASIKAIRDYSVVFLIPIFLIGGMVSGYISVGDGKKVTKSFLKGVVSALPGIAMILIASSIKYILEEGKVLDTISYSVSCLTKGGNKFAISGMLFSIILVLEFFISSSTAKACFVMGILKGIKTSISKELIVLIFLFGDGYTNVLFPTSPVLLIGLAMTGIGYGTWIKKSKWLFLGTLLLTIAFLALAVVLY